jgi:DNA (cytosine-5)-methyltransferase 1
MRRALDLYCCAGDATRGLQQAGFRVTGVDIRRQPNYSGDAFVLGDALEFLRSADLSQFAYITASPPCQAYSVLRHAPGEHRDADLIGPTREALIRTGLPYVIENVEGARDRLINPIMLCGSMFGLKTPNGAQLRRHRLFETSFPLAAPSRCRHRRPTIGVYGGHFRDRRRETGKNHRPGSNLPLEHGFIAMGIDWRMTTAEVSEAIPPAYARFVAEAFFMSGDEEGVIANALDELAWETSQALKTLKRQLAPETTS